MLALISTPAGSSPVELAEVREPSAAPNEYWTVQGADIPPGGVGVVSHPPPLSHRQASGP